MRVLLIDDDEDIRRLGRFSLEVVGRFEARVAGSGADGVALASELRPDLIVLDVHMPGMDGVAVLGELRGRATLRDVPVIFMTATPGPADVARYLELGAIGVVKKPFDPMTLPDQLRRILNDRGGRRRPTRVSYDAIPPRGPMPVSQRCGR